MYTIHLGFSGFPYGMASVQRTKLTFKGLEAAGKKTLIINKISHHQYTHNRKVNRHEGLLYINTAFYNSRPDSFLKRNLNKLSGYFGELALLFKKRKHIETAILYSNYFLEYPYYFLLSKLFGFKIVIQYVEMFSAIPGRNDFFTKINDQLIDKYIGHFCNGIIAISTKLNNHVQKIKPGLPIIQIPANADFEQIAKIAPAKESNYLMYCGTIYYLEVIEFILLLFEKLKENNQYDGKLLLVISGNEEKNQQELSELIKKNPFSEQVIFKKDIDYTELIGNYKSADLLLIPLRNSIQDTARFPHKIAEYTACSRPILSTKTGEIEQTFLDGSSALLAKEYNIDDYYKKISENINDKEKLSKIGHSGHDIGVQIFDYKSQGVALAKFIRNI